MKKIMFFVILSSIFLSSFLGAAQQKSSDLDKNDPYYMGCDEDFQEQEAKRIKTNARENTLYAQLEGQRQKNYDSFLKNKYDKYLIYSGADSQFIPFDAWRQNNASYTEYSYGSSRAEQELQNKANNEIVEQNKANNEKRASAERIREILQNQDLMNYDNFLMNKYNNLPIHIDKNGAPVFYRAWLKDNYSMAEYLDGSWRNEK